MRSHLGPSHTSAVLDSLSQTAVWRRHRDEAGLPVSSLSPTQLVSVLHWLVDNADVIAKAQKLIPNAGLTAPAIGGELDWLLATPFVNELVERLYVVRFQASLRETGRLSPSPDGVTA